MKSVLLVSLLCGAAALPFASLAVPSDPSVLARVQDPVKQDPQPAAQDMAAMMAKAAKFTQPGPNHEVLKRFLGSWDVELKLTGMPMGGKMVSTGEWLLDGRVIEMRSEGSMMGQPHRSFLMMGYDNFKQSFVSTMVSSMDTAMLRSEGDLTRDGKALITYGTLDEYLTGEHDKMVKYVWRFVSDDEIVQEVHDLPIGETGTKVVELRYTRRK